MTMQPPQDFEVSTTDAATMQAAIASLGGSWDGVFTMLMASNVLALVFLSRLVRHELRRWLRRRWAC